MFISHQEQQSTILAPSIPSTTTSTDAVSILSLSANTGSPYKDKLIASLGIPVELTDHSDINLGYSWRKYKACLKAIETCNLLWQGKQLREVFDRKPTQVDIISVFKGKTQWHLTYAKAFPKLAEYPAMVSWLEDSDDKLSDFELWGVEKLAYGFSDLLEWLNNDGVGLSNARSKEKGKGKEKEMERSKEKRKGREKEMEKGKRKDKGEKGKDKGKGKAKEVTGGNKKKVRMNK